MRLPGVQDPLRPPRRRAAATTGSCPTAGCALDGFGLDDARWDALRIPVEMAFFFHSSGARARGRALPEPRWARPSRCSSSRPGRRSSAPTPCCATLEPDVEALLVNRARGARQYFLVPIEDPTGWSALIRTRWRGLTGGREVWEEIERFFEALSEQAKPVDRQNARGGRMAK